MSKLVSINYLEFFPFTFGMVPGVYPLDFKGRHAFNFDKSKSSLSDDKKLH
jgi:hypothetical protein